ncbi:uncharacterized protein LOC100211361 isoform X2 [Hydra vulgaris]|uniref:Uncharacterized protein LOC100211361 isoform X2 n=1 Tax=Hydra vulgaris TaxID=6087 RepID=A0ABM4DG64_HYDVU
MYSVYSFPVLVAFLLYIENPNDKDTYENDYSSNTSIKNLTTQHTYPSSKILESIIYKNESEDIEYSLIRDLGSSHFVYKVELKNSTGVKVNHVSRDSEKRSNFKDLLAALKSTSYLVELLVWFLITDFIIIFGLITVNILATTLIRYVMKIVNWLHFRIRSTIFPQSTLNHKGLDQEVSLFKEIETANEQRCSSMIEEKHDDAHIFSSPECCDVPNNLNASDGDNFPYSYIFESHDDDLHSTPLDYSYKKNKIYHSTAPYEFSPKKLKQYLREKYLELDRLGITIDENGYFLEEKMNMVI